MFSVAIDGPGGAGKSTIAKACAAKLQFVYVDTGALYRTVAHYMIRNNIDIEDTQLVSSALDSVKIEIRYKDGSQYVYCNNEDVSELIRTPKVSMAASKVSAIPAVRAFLLNTQRDIAKSNNVIMDGRDIGTVVLPHASLKIFLTASAEARAKRRFDELSAKGEDVTYEAVLSDLQQRDYQDTHRDIAPLKQADDAVLVDTSDLTLNDSIEKIVSLVQSAYDKSDDKMKAVKSEPQSQHNGSFKNDDTGLDFKLKTGPNKLEIFLRIILWPLYRILFWYTVKGKENLPRSGGYIFCSNHVSALDPILWVIVSPRRLHFMGKEELFKNPVFGRVLRAFDVFAIKRGAGDMNSINFASEIVKNGEILGIFPEGTRSKDGTPGRAKSGVAFLANDTGADVIPAAVVVKGNKGIAPFRKFKLIIGKPIPHSEIEFDDNARGNLRRVSKRIMADITELWEQNQF